MMKELTMTRFIFLLPMAACAVMLAGCDEKKEEPKPEQPVEVVQESGEECLQRAIDKLALGEIDAADAAVKKAIDLLPDSAEALNAPSMSSVQTSLVDFF